MTWGKTGRAGWSSFFLAAALGTLLGCGGAGQSGIEKPAPAPAPLISRFEATPALFTAGDPCRLVAEFTNGTGVIAPGIGAVASGTPVTVRPSVSTQYSLTVTNAEGAAASRELAVTVIPAPRIEALSADPALVTDGQSVRITPVFTGGTGAMEPGIGPVQSGVPVTVRPSGNSTYTLTVTNPLGATVSQELTITVVPPPFIASFQATSTLLQEGQSALITAVFVDGTATLEPGIGPIQSGVPVPVAPRATTAYTLTVTSPAGVSITRTLQITVDGNPVITSFAAQPPAISFGGSTLLTAVFSGGTGVLDHGLGTIASGQPVSVSPSATDTYTLRVYNNLGRTVQQDVTVRVESLPLIQGFTASSPFVPPGQPCRLVATFINGTGVIEPSVGPVTSGQEVTVTPTATTIYTLTVTNALGGTATRALTVSVVELPVITSFTPNPATIGTGQSTQLTAVFANGNGTIDHGVGAVASGTPRSVSPTATTTYTLTVTNLMGVSVTRTAVVTVIPPPVITSFSATPTDIIQGQSLTLAATYTGGTGTIDHGVGDLASGGSVVVSPTADTTYTLTVTSPLGTAVTRTCAVTVTVPGAPFISSFLADPATITTGDTSQLMGVFINGTGTVDNGVGTIGTGVAKSVSPSSSTTYTLTVSNAVGASASRTATITVVPPPAILGFSASATTITAGDTVLLTPDFTGGTGTITPGVGMVTSGAAVPVVPGGNTTYTLTVTNSAGLAITRTVSVTVIPAPLITSFTANSTSIPDGSSVTLTAIFSGGTGAIDQGIGALTSGSSVTVKPLASTTYTLTVTNSLGAAVTLGLFIKVVQFPTITSFTAVPAGVVEGGSTQLVAIFQDGNGVINQGVGAVTSGVGVAVYPIVDTTYTLIVSNPAGASVSQTVTVSVTPTGISFMVGNIAGEGYQDGTGGTARLRSPASMALDASGSIFVCDTWNQTIRKITSGNVVTTLAGSPGEEGSTDGLGASARFRNPMGIAITGSGTLFVADSGNHTIRAIDLAGNVTTVAGLAGSQGSANGNGAVARFNAPEGLALDAGGTLYIADTGNHTIRAMDASFNVTTLAGSAGLTGSADGTGGAARFYEPSALMVDGSSNLYVTDRANHTLRKITSGAVVSTLAGTAGVSGSTDATGSLARFNRPDGVTRNSTGEIYVADSGNHTLRWYAAGSGSVSTIAGSSGVAGFKDGSGTAARFRMPRALAMDSLGDIIIADSLNHSVRLMVPGPWLSTSAGSPPILGTTDGTGFFALFSGPRGLAVDPSGNILVADTGNHSLRRVTPFRVCDTLAGMTGTSGYANGSGTAARFQGLSSVCVDASGNAFVADTLNHVIRKVNAAGDVTTFAGSAGNPGSTNATGTLAQFRAPLGIALGAGGYLYVADSGNHTIRKISPTGAVTTLAGSPGASGTADGSGSAARFKDPEDLVVDASGNIYVADTGNHTIRMVTATGDVSTYAGTAGVSGKADGNGTSASFRSPCALDIDAAGQLYIADTGNHTIRLITTTGDVYTAAGRAGLAQVITGALPGGLVSPRGILVHPYGYLVVATANGLVTITGI